MRVRLIKLSSKTFRSISRIKRICWRRFPKRAKLKHRFNFETVHERYTRLVQKAEAEHEAQIKKEWEETWNQRNVGLRIRSMKESGLW